jgi:small subunit ribosomal protein S26e
VSEQDKIIKRFMVKDFFDASTKKDLTDASAYPGLAGTNQGLLMPKLYLKNQYCISCAIHLRVVRVRNSEDRKQRFQRHVRPEARRVRKPFSISRE